MITASQAESSSAPAQYRTGYIWMISLVAVAAVAFVAWHVNRNPA